MSEFLGLVLAYLFGAATVAFVWAMVAWERDMDQEQREAERSPLEMYKAAGKTPTGRTADILREAERGYSRRQRLDPYGVASIPPPAASTPPPPPPPGGGPKP